MGNKEKEKYLFLIWGLFFVIVACVASFFMIIQEKLMSFFISVIILVIGSFVYLILQDKVEKNEDGRKK